MTAELDELKWKRGAGVWYTARDDEDDPPLKKIDGCRRDDNYHYSDRRRLF